MGRDHQKSNTRPRAKPPTKKSTSLRTKLGRLRAAKDPATPQEVLEKFLCAPWSDDKELCAALASNPRAGENIFERLVWSGNPGQELSLALARNPSCPGAVLARIACWSDEDDAVIDALLERASLEPAVIEALVGSPSADIRGKVFQKFPDNSTVKVLEEVLGGSADPERPLGPLSAAAARQFLQTRKPTLLRILSNHPDTPTDVLDALVKDRDVARDIRLLEGLARRRPVIPALWGILPKSLKYQAVAAGEQAPREVLWELALEVACPRSNDNEKDCVPARALDAPWMPADIRKGARYLMGPLAARGKDPKKVLNRAIIDELLATFSFHFANELDGVDPWAVALSLLVIHPDFPLDVFQDLVDDCSRGLCLEHTIKALVQSPHLTLQMGLELMHYYLDQMLSALRAGGRLSAEKKSLLVRLEEEEQKRAATQREWNLQQEKKGAERMAMLLSMRPLFKKYGPFRWQHVWTGEGEVGLVWGDGGPATHKTPGAVGVFLDNDSAEALQGMFWFHDTREATEALILVLPLLFEWTGLDSLEERLELFHAACGRLPANIEEDPDWSNIRGWVDRMAQSEILAIGSARDFTRNAAASYTRVREKWRSRSSCDGSSCDRGDGKPISPGKEADFWEWLSELSRE
jgi:hypothetical protein